MVGDWGTGLQGAQNVGTQMGAAIAEGKADGREVHVLHPGDVYYSGWKEEYASRFMPYWPVKAAGDVAGSWALNGNHDMYSGGQGYFGHLLEDVRFLGQGGSSHFALETSKWRLLGLDSAYKDADLAGHQAQWVAQKMADGSGRRTMLLTHHQPFSAFAQPSGAPVSTLAAAGVHHDRDVAVRAPRFDGGVSGRSRDFGWLWAAFAVSTAGTWLAFDAFPLIAILVLHAGPAAVSALAAASLAVGAAVAVPLGPWVERRRKRRVMVAMDLGRCAALLSVPAAYALGRLTFAQLLVVSVAVAAADIAFKAASGACLKGLVAPERLLMANARFESTSWTATALCPPLGGALIGLLGPVTTVLANAGSFLVSALGIRAIGGREPLPAAAPRRPRLDELLDGWRHILGHPTLRRLFFNTVLVNGLIMATAPPMAVLMLGRLGFAPWQYGLAFGAPCVGGLVGARLSRRLVARHGVPRVLRGAGTLRACWSLALAFVVPGVPGLVLVMTAQLGLVTSVGVFNPVYATHRLEQTPPDRVARTLSAWSATSSATIAALTALWGVLAAVTSPRAAIAAAGLLLLVTPLLLPREASAERAGVREGDGGAAAGGAAMAA